MGRFAGWAARWLGRGLLWPVLGLLVVWPLGLLVERSLEVATRTGGERLGFGNYIELVSHVDWLWNTFLIAGGGTLGGTFLAVVMAWILNRTDLPGQSIFESLVILPYYMTPLVGGLAWHALGSPESGLINRLFREVTGGRSSLIDTTSLPGVTWVMALFEAPAAYLMIGAALRAMDPSLEEASAVLGGSRFVTVRKITLPLLRPAILGASLFLFSIMLGAFAIPAILGTRRRIYVATTAIYVLVQGYPPRYGLAAALGMVLVLWVAVAISLYRRFLGSESYAVIGGRTYRPRRIEVRSWRWLFWLVCLVYVVIAVVLPVGMLVYASVQPTNVIGLHADRWTLDHYRYILFAYEPSRQAIWNSVVLGVLTGSLGVVLALWVCMYVFRSGGMGSRAMEYVAMVPQAVPGLVFALGLLWCWTVLAGRILGTIWVLLLAYVTLFLPVGVRGLAGVIVQIDRSLEEAARVIGANPRKVFNTITLPLLRPGIVSTWMLLFISAVREVSSSVLLSSPSSRVLGPTIYNFWESGGLPDVSALTVFQTFVILIPMLLLRHVVDRRSTM